MQLINVILIDDHSLFRNGLKSLLEDEGSFKVIAQTDNGYSGIELVKRHNVDVVLLDLDMKGLSGIDTLKALLEYNKDLCVIILTVSENSDNLQKCIDLGAKGYLLKNINIDFLIYSIKTAIEGNNIFSPEMTTRLVGKLSKKENRENNKQLSELSSREKDILILLTKGASNKQLAKTLNLTENTIKVHVQNILKKLNLHSRVQAAVYALENNLVDDKNEKSKN